MRRIRIFEIKFLGGKKKDRVIMCFQGVENSCDVIIYFIRMIKIFNIDNIS